MMWNINAIGEMEKMRREMDSIMQRFGYNTSEEPSFPLINVYDKGNDIEIAAELPGVEKNDVSVMVDNGVLKISGSRTIRTYGSNFTSLRTECPSGKFEKTMRLPVKIMEEGITATFKDGVLLLTLPKADEAKPKQITIS